MKTFMAIGIAAILAGSFLMVLSYRSSIERPFSLAPIDMANPR